MRQRPRIHSWLRLVKLTTASPHSPSSLYRTLLCCAPHRKVRCQAPSGGCTRLPAWHLTKRCNVREQHACHCGCSGWHRCRCANSTPRSLRTLSQVVLSIPTKSVRHISDCSDNSRRSAKAPSGSFARTRLSSQPSANGSDSKQATTSRSEASARCLLCRSRSTRGNHRRRRVASKPSYFDSRIPSYWSAGQVKVSVHSREVVRRCSRC
mmetsp:Transcript_70182/g.116590  ORF Transcript_70182/g.116590 Transcript_70182/m.116590 type:complete len:209 (+) Transcript_70182:1060-1686(+)